MATESRRSNEWLPNGAATVSVVRREVPARTQHQYEPAYSEQISAGYERQLLGDLRIGVNYYYAEENLIGIQNTAVSPSDYVRPPRWERTILNPVTGQPMTLFSFQRPIRQSLGPSIS